jgi:membrane protein
VAIAVAGFVFSQESVQTALAAQMSAYVGTAGIQATQAIIRSAHRPFVGTIAGTLGVLVLLIGASGVFVELQQALNVIWRVNNQKSGLRQMMSLSWTGFLMVLTTGILLLASVVVSTILAALGKFAGSALPSPESLLHLLDIAVSFAITTFLFAMMFKVLPKAHIAWKDVWVGAAVTAIMFDIGKLLITLYLGKSSIASAYGAASSLVILIGWVYYSADLVFRRRIHQGLRRSAWLACGVTGPSPTLRCERGRGINFRAATVSSHKELPEVGLPPKASTPMAA